MAICCGSLSELDADTADGQKLIDGCITNINNSKISILYSIIVISSTPGGAWLILDQIRYESLLVWQNNLIVLPDWGVITGQSLITCPCQFSFGGLLGSLSLHIM